MTTFFTAMRRRFSLALVMVAVLTLGFANTAQAAGELELSKDGNRWAQSIAAPLFDPQQKLVPGGSLKTEFWARNSGPSAAQLSVKLGSTTLGELFQRDLLSLSVSASNGTVWTASRTASNSANLLADLPVSGTQKLTLTISLAVAAANDTELRSVPVDLQLILAGTAGDNHPVPPQKPELPNTGIVMLPLLLAFACFVGGWFAVLATRRRRDRAAMIPGELQ
ncbi:LPXTG cell wall anchor domain-containing protein [Psychromicrobium lacuslunae]|uniref:Gram-positive cocci surface proteins LPxTG domain-containing protein n=1 Tax=Psychromicrobium lacuslunae TaxID=1618207 RepID=A0A0D4BVH6_9MICC|nr:LPXTG cell wall anchor domain-containing protein [Psychromicrobium lacuslunae]AJT40447.1 hypothetical protein UM93_00760 [Psychromicrobium lacuslunae]